MIQNTLLFEIAVEVEITECLLSLLRVFGPVRDVRFECSMFQVWPCDTKEAMYAEGLPLPGQQATYPKISWAQHDQIWSNMIYIYIYLYYTVMISNKSHNTIQYMYVYVILCNIM